MTLWVVLLAAVYIAYRLYARFFMGPHTANQELTMKVWAAFGPYETAEYAANYLRRAARVVFPRDALSSQEQWLAGHIQNFNQWEKENSLPQCQEIMKSALLSRISPAAQDACNRFRADLAAEVAKGAEWINSEFFEQGGHRLEVVNRPDGGVDLKYNQIWSEQAIQQKMREDAQSIMTAIGTRLLDDDSTEAQSLMLFLKNLQEAGTDNQEPSATGIGKTWLICMNHASDEPGSEISRAFKELNEAWIPADAERA